MSIHIVRVIKLSKNRIIIFTYLIFSFLIFNRVCIAAESANVSINTVNQSYNNLPDPEKKQINVLSLDGGGVKSITTLKILEYIEKKTGKRITELFDVVDGTSSGGVLALYLTVPDPANPKRSRYSTSDIIQIFENDSREIFKPRCITWLIPTRLLQAVMPGYKIGNIENTFSKRFENKKLSDLVVKTIILSFNSETTESFLLKSYDKLLRTPS